MKTTAFLRTADGREIQVDTREGLIGDVTFYYPDFVPGDALDEDAGVIWRLEAPDSDYLAIRRHSEFWCSPAFGNDLRLVPDETQLLLCRSGENWLALLPVVGSDYKCVFFGAEGGLCAKQFSWVKNRADCRDPAFVAAEGTDPFETTERAVRAAAKVLGSPVREDRRYPEIFKYLGWCSWDALQIRVSEAGVLEKCAEFREKGIPVKWAILDDMWAEVAPFNTAVYNSREEMFRLMHSSPLYDYEASYKRFPNGLKHAIEKIHACGIKVGIWHPSTGYWFGLDPAGEAYRKLSDYTVALSDGRIISDWHENMAFAYFNTMHRFFRSCGADFLKVDNQSMTRRFYKGMETVGRVTREWHRGLEASVGLNFDNAMINCMGMASEDMWNRGFSPISRCSDDFQPENRPWFTKHILQCAYNSVLQGQFFWSDYDMWWTDDTQAEKNSVLRAVSGGPIYVSDEIGRSRAEVFAPLCLSDGRILRCDRVGMPTADCLTVDPTTSGKPIKIQNISNGCGILAAFNLSSDNTPVSGTVGPEDVPGLEGEEYVVFEHFSRSVTVVPKTGRIHVSLSGNDDYRLYVIVPIQNGFAPIGRADKFVSPAAIAARIGEEVTLAEPGPYAYVKNGKYYEEAYHE